MYQVSPHSFFLRLLIGPDKKLRIIRHTLLWSTGLFVIYYGFHLLATNMTDPSEKSIQHYSLSATLLFGGMTILDYWLVTTLTRRFVLLQFRIDLFILGILLVHIATAEIVLVHFWYFTCRFQLTHLPLLYTRYADHIAHLSIWQAPVDPVIVWFFSFSLFYNYLLYAIGFKAFKDLFTISLRQTTLEKENLQLEFDFLKSQINPHFLFNTLNNIYSFVIRSPDKAAVSILKLADLMRYTLYETAEERVLLTKELAFLTSYIDLQRIRHDDHVSITVSILGEPTTQLIPPLLLIVFVENAFKHGVQSSALASWITIQIQIKENDFQFSVSNSVPALKPVGAAGIGLSNVIKRLHYFYPNRHQLAIDAQSTQFIIQLTLQSP